MTDRRPVETCAICDAPIRKRDHELCRACVEANNWSPARFQYAPSGFKRRAQ